MGEDKVCLCEELHRNHLCMLRIRGMTNAIKHETNSPNVACDICGEEANSEDDVCEPIWLFI